jgi:transcriptional regulator with XRE-family HTH domain
LQLHEIGIKIRSIRKDKKITQEALAKNAGISRVTLGKIERGEFGIVSVQTLDAILFVLGYEMTLKELSGFGLPVLGEIEE